MAGGVILRHTCGCMLVRHKLVGTKAWCQQHGRAVYVETGTNWAHYVYSLLGALPVELPEGPRPSDGKVPPMR